jgi:TatD DNase family protein
LSYLRRGYVDVHAHIIHEKFTGQEADIAQSCIDHGLDYVIVNGLEPVSNRKILAYHQEFPTVMLPALGIYPLDAACHSIFTEEQTEELQTLRAQLADPAQIPSDNAFLQLSMMPTEPNWKHPFPPPTKFDLQAEIDFIESQLQAKTIVAIGECGMDGHYLSDAGSIAAQEAVLRQLMRLGKKYDVPVILHTRKMEKKVFEMLLEEGVTKADFHCYCGKLNLAKQIAEAGYYLSIPSAIAGADKSSSFHKLATTIPLNRLLTETDSPYMGPVKGENNTPITVTQSIATFAACRNLPEEEVLRQVRQNFKDLFSL